ncbi:hypothetical protein [Amycolatopsis sp. NBC_00438]|uniref:hypothetical protein n=1 Tax=Amycolatopsis sp. NBC_00438 TaxID=2903558 RepID=UPI002E1DBE83
MPNAGRNHQRRGKVADKAARQVRAYELSLRGHSLREVARIMTTEGMRVSHEGARTLIELEAAERVSPLAEQYRTLLIERLNVSRLAVLKVLERDHLTISDGQIVRLDGEPIIDDGPVLQAVDRLLKIDTQLAKLTGAEAPVESIVSATVTARPAELDDLIAKARTEQQAAERELAGG